MLKKILILLIIILVIAAIAGAIYFLVIKKAPAEVIINNQTNNNSNSEQLPGNTNGDLTNTNSQNVLRPGEKEQAEVEAVARFFVEMLGTYSPEARFKNIIDLKPLMTLTMQTWADDLIQRNMAAETKSNERITTQALKIETISFASDSRAEFLVETRRTQENNEGNKVYNQQAQIVILKQAGEWKVEGVNWK
jgi:hypothetical protein